MRFATETQTREIGKSNFVCCVPSTSFLFFLTRAQKLYRSSLNCVDCPAPLHVVTSRHHRFGLVLNAAGVELVMLDLPGHGRTAPSVSKLGRDVPEFGVLVDCVEDFILHATAAEKSDDHGGTLPFFLFGHSWGGVLTFLAALRPAVAAMFETGSSEDVPTATARGRGVILSAPAFRVGGNVLVPRPCVLFCILPPLDSCSFPASRDFCSPGWGSNNRFFPSVLLFFNCETEYA